METYSRQDIGSTKTHVYMDDNSKKHNITVFYLEDLVRILFSVEDLLSAMGYVEVGPRIELMRRQNLYTQSLVQPDKDVFVHVVPQHQLLKFIGGIHKAKEASHLGAWLQATFFAPQRSIKPTEKESHPPKEPEISLKDLKNFRRTLPIVESLFQAALGDTPAAKAALRGWLKHEQGVNVNEYIELGGGVHDTYDHRGKLLTEARLCQKLTFKNKADLMHVLKKEGLVYMSRSRESGADDDAGVWLFTNKGRPFGEYVDMGKVSKEQVIIYDRFWYESVIDSLKGA